MTTDLPNFSFTDSYLIFTVSYAVIMITNVYYPGLTELAPSYETAIKAATSAGTVLGQIVFGLLADFMGRKRV